MKLWYQSTLSFDQHPNYAKALTAHFRRVGSPGTEVSLHGRDAVLAGRTLASGDVIGSPVMYHAMVTTAFIKSLIEAERNGADAFIVASFSEPILTELRSLARIPVVSMPEVTFMAASMCAPKVGLVTLNKGVVRFIEKSAVMHKWQGRLNGIHLMDAPVTEEELDENFAHPGKYIDMLVSGIRKAIGAGAQVVIPAEGVLGVMAAENGLTEVDGVPVVDVIGTLVLFAELAVALKQRTGLVHSAAAYTAPTDDARKALAASFLTDASGA